MAGLKKGLAVKEAMTRCEGSSAGDPVLLGKVAKILDQKINEHLNRNKLLKSSGLSVAASNMSNGFYRRSAG